MKLFFNKFLFLFLFFASPLFSLENYQRTTVGIYTSMGDIFIQLFDDECPNTVDRFLSYVEDGFYDQTLIHRVINDYIVQGGGFHRDFTYKSVGTSIRNESKKHLKNVRGTIGMAHTVHDHSARSQFYFNVIDNPELDYQNRRNKGFVVFGEIIQGLDVLDEIASVKTRKTVKYYSLDDFYVFERLPIDPIIVHKMVIEQDGFFLNIRD